MKSIIVIYGITMLGCAVIGAFLWPYSINEWLVFLGKEPTVVWWQGAILGFVPFIGQATIPVAVMTWVLMLVLI